MSPRAVLVDKGGFRQSPARREESEVSESLSFGMSRSPSL